MPIKKEEIFFLVQQTDDEPYNIGIFSVIGSQYKKELPKMGTPFLNKLKEVVGQFFDIDDFELATSASITEELQTAFQHGLSISVDIEYKEKTEEDNEEEEDEENEDEEDVIRTIEVSIIAKY